MHERTFCGRSNEPRAVAKANQINRMCYSETLRVQCGKDGGGVDCVQQKSDVRAFGIVVGLESDGAGGGRWRLGGGGELRDGH